MTDTALGPACTIDQAALELGKSPKQVRLMIEQGAPCVRRGRRGRGCTTLVDPSALQAWEVARADDAAKLVLMLAADVPAIVECAIDQAFMSSQGPHRRALAGSLAATYYLVTTALLDRCREDAPATPDVHTLPEKIIRLRAIFDDSRKVRTSQREDHL